MDQCLRWSVRKYCAEEIRISNVIECAQKEEKEKQLEIAQEQEKAHLEMNWIAKYQDIYAKVSQKVGRMVQQKRDDNSKSKGSGSMWLERMKLPVFSGNIRDFPPF